MGNSGSGRPIIARAAALAGLGAAGVGRRPAPPRPPPPRPRGQRPRFFRPPYGVLSSGAVIAARRLGLTPVLWSSWGKEWAPGATADSVFTAVSAGLTGGATILLHDSDCTSPAGAASAALGALPWGLDECSARGLAVGTLADHGLG